MRNESLEIFLIPSSANSLRSVADTFVTDYPIDSIVLNSFELFMFVKHGFTTLNDKPNFTKLNGDEARECRYITRR